MRYSKLFGKTQRNISQDMKMPSHQLLFKGGFVRESTAGRYYFLPLGMRVQNKIMNIIREEMNRAGSQEMVTPILHPLELWKETNRTNSAGFELMKVKDRRGAEFALGGTAEEMFVDIVRKYQLSYKDLPFNIYQFSNKFRDEMRARGGLLRVREFIMKDAYSFDIDEEAFKKEYENMWRTYTKIFNRLGLETFPVLADNGYIGGEYCHEFVSLNENGESRFLMTGDGKYCVHVDIAKFKIENKNIEDAKLPLEKVHAERGNTMEDGVKLHGLPLWQQIKDVMYIDEKGRYILAIIRGDLDVNEVKLSKLVGSYVLEHASEEDIRNKLHSEPGFISPVGIKENIIEGVELIIVSDSSIRTIVNAYGGANAKYEDLKNINIDRDFTPDIEGDIAQAKAGYLSESGQELFEKRGIEVGNIFQLGYHYTNLMEGAVYIDKDGKEQKYYMGCYGIGLGRTLAAIVEKYHDEKGIIWPENVAPYKYHLINLGKEFEKETEDLYNSLIEKGEEVLWDDRDVSAGEKFNDADLIGIPYRVVVSKKSKENGGYEVRIRNSNEIIYFNKNKLI